MRTRDSLRKKKSSQSSSRLPPKNSSVPSSVPVKDSTQVFIPRDNSLVESTDWSIQASPAVKSAGEEEKLTPSALPSNWNFNRLIDSLLENGGSPPLAYPNSRTSAPEIQPQTLPSDEVGLVQPAKESPGEINQVKSTPHVELGNKTVGTHPPHPQADIDSPQIDEKSNQQQVAQGVSYLGGVYLGDIELPNLPEKDPNFTWELLVKVLVEIFKFPSREYAEALLKYLGENQYPIRISYSIIIHANNPDREVLAIYAENQDAVSFYQKEANQALSQASSQAIQREYINPLDQFNSEIFNVATRENYIGELNQLSPEIRTQLDDFFNNLQETIKKDIENKATEIYGQVATIDNDVELYEAIIIQVLYEKFPTEFENIISGEVETTESPFNINHGATPEINIPIPELPSGNNQPSEITISEIKINIPILELPFPYEPPSEKTEQIPTTNLGNNPDSGQNSPQTTGATQREQLDSLSPEIQSLLGGRESFQPEYYEQLLNIGNNIREFFPEEIQSYQVARQRFGWNLNQLQGSVNTYITVRDRLQGELQGQKYKQTLDSLLFSEISTPEKEKIDWWQLFKDLISSTLGSYKYAPEVLGELWAEVKEHWPLFVGTIVGLFIAEKAVVALAGAPEPTFLTKVLAVAIQSAIIAIYGVSIVVEGGNAAVALAEWFTTTLEAKGNPDKIEAASKAFLRGIGHLLLVILGSNAFQKQISLDRLAALQAMLGRVRGQGSLRLPDGTPTIDLYPDPDNPGSYVFRTSPQPNPGGSGGNLLPPSSRPAVSIPQPQTPRSPGGSPLTTIGDATPGGVSQVPPVTEVPGSLIPGEITPTNPVPTNPVPTNPVPVPTNPVPTNPPERLPFAEPPQPLDIIPNLQPPTFPGLNPEPPGNVVKPGTEPVQDVTPGSGQTTSPPTSNPPVTNPNQTPTTGGNQTRIPGVRPPLTTEARGNNTYSVREAVMVNALGENHEFKLLPNGTIIRCSEDCTELAVSVRQQLRDLLNSQYENLSTRAEMLRKRASTLIEESSKKTRYEDELIYDILQLEDDISALKREVGSEETETKVDINQLQSDLSELDVNEVLDQYGMSGLQKLQNAKDKINLDDLKGLIIHLGANKFVDLIANYELLPVQIALDVAKEIAELTGNNVDQYNKKIEIAAILLAQPRQSANVKTLEEQFRKNRRKQGEDLSEQRDTTGKRLLKLQSKQEALRLRQSSPNYPPLTEDELKELANLPDRIEKTKILLEETDKLLPDARRREENAQYASKKNPFAQIDQRINTSIWALLPCFLGDTLIWTADGVRRIDELKIGELVFTFDFERQEVVKREILQVLRNQTNHFYKIMAGNDTIKATGNHLFWVEDKSAWLAARDLKADMYLKALDKKAIKIDSILLQEGIESETYNLSIDQIHNYFVGTGVLVHNEGPHNYDFGDSSYNFIIYHGKNENFPNRVYVGQTDPNQKREAAHRSEAERELKKLVNQDKLVGVDNWKEKEVNELIQILRDEGELTDKQLSDVRYYIFKKNIDLDVKVTGISAKMADYLEQKNMDIQRELLGEDNVMNRRDEIKTTKEAVYKAVMAELEVINKRQGTTYCK